MPLFRRHSPPAPPTDPSWVDDEFVVIGIDNDAMPVSYRGEELPFGLSRTIGDAQIHQFLGRTLHYRATSKHPARQLLDTSSEGRQQTGITRCKTQLRLRVAPGKTGMSIWFEIYVCWQEATGRELDLLEGPPPPAEEVP